jgi:hypothetical protein
LRGFSPACSALRTIGVFAIVFALRYAELRCFSAKNFRTVENDREKIFVEWRAFSSRVRRMVSTAETSVHITLWLPCVEQKSTIRRVNYWNITADTLDRLTQARF